MVDMFVPSITTTLTKRIENVLTLNCHISTALFRIRNPTGQVLQDGRDGQMDHIRIIKMHSRLDITGVQVAGYYWSGAGRMVSSRMLYGYYTYVPLAVLQEESIGVQLGYNRFTSHQILRTTDVQPAGYSGVWMPCWILQVYSRTV
jgi:hypothetical protein